MTTHRDCRNYAPIDVVKGMCHVNKAIVLGDGASCDAFNLMPKCKHCAQFKPSADVVEMGTCLASTQEPPFFAYPDLVAVTCDGFRQS
jgi:4-hydroxyphenylacetate decarboxylase small subunit